MRDDEWQSLGAIAASLVNRVAPGPGEESEPGAALAGTGVARRAHHDGEPRGGAGADVIFVDFRRGTGAAARGPNMPPRPDHRTPDGRVGPSRVPPATGGLGNARRAKR